MRHRIVHLMLIVALTAGCHAQQGKEDKKDAPAEAPAVAEGTPATVTSVTVGAMEETVEVNAVSAFQLKTYIKANTNGYLQTVNARLGSYVEKGQELFVLKQKNRKPWAIPSGYSTALCILPVTCTSNRPAAVISHNSITRQEIMCRTMNNWQ